MTPGEGSSGPGTGLRPASSKPAPLRPPTIEAPAPRPPVGAPQPAAGRSRATAPAGLPVLLATALLGAGIIHLVMVPSHLNVWTAEGIAFLVVGWAQIGLAVAAAWRLGRTVLHTIVWSNVVFVIAWGVTRTVGAPIGPNPGSAESSSVVDLAAVALEVIAIILALALLRGGTWRRPRPLSPVLVGIAASLLLGLSSVALLSPEARDHAHASDTAGPGVPGQHAHTTVEPVAVDPETAARLDEQLAVTTRVQNRLRTVADAEAAGYYRSGPFIPGLGAHWVKPDSAAAQNVDGVIDRNDLAHPLGLLYGGTDLDSELVGIMYWSAAPERPEGLVGPNDHWHRHTNVCLRPSGENMDLPLGLDGDVSEEQCAGVEGSLVPQTDWMLHVWTVPGWVHPDDIFAEANPTITCPDGTYEQRPMEEWGDTPLNTCQSAEP